MPLSLTSRLDAVNTILMSVGETPVDSLSGNTADASNAAAVLDEVSRAVQSEGWRFNTETDVPFTPADDGTITLPGNVLSFEASPESRSSVDPVQRGLRLYDRKARSYSFAQPVKAKVTYLLDFEELPEVARAYIATRAALIFQDRFVGADANHQFTQQDELVARVALVESDLKEVNILTSNPQWRYGMRR